VMRLRTRADAWRRGAYPGAVRPHRVLGI